MFYMYGCASVCKKYGKYQKEYFFMILRMVVFISPKHIDYLNSPLSLKPVTNLQTTDLKTNTVDTDEIL